MTKKQVEELGSKVIDWCAKKYGWSKFYRGYTVMLEVQYECDTDKVIYGEFDQDEVMIFVYTRMNRSITTTVNTLIHEFQHYLQSPQWIGRYISKYGNSTKKNPYERQATFIANRDTKECMKELGL